MSRHVAHPLSGSHCSEWPTAPTAPADCYRPEVLCVRRSFEVAELGARIDSHLLTGPHHRVLAGGVTGDVVFDARLLPPEPPASRTYLYLLLEGALYLPRARHPLARDAMVLAPSRDALFRTLGAHHRGPFRIVALQVASEVLPAPLRLGVLPLGARLREAAEAFHSALAEGGAGSEAHQALLHSLAAAGIPIASDRLLARTSPVTGRIDELAAALSSTLSRAGTRPALVDLAAGSTLSERTARRLLPRAAAEYGFTYRGWRPLRRAFSTTVACILLTVPAATPGFVSRRTGFASAISLCHALRHAGLPAPRALQQLAGRIRRGEF